MIGCPSAHLRSLHFGHHGDYDDNVTCVTNAWNARLQFVPYFKNKAAEEAAIAETQREIALAYPNGYVGQDALRELIR